MSIAVAVAAGGERRRAGIARGGADDRHMLAPPRQRRVEQRADQLQRQILEREGRPVKQLHQPQPLVELHQRRHRGMAKAAIGLRRNRCSSAAENASPANKPMIRAASSA